MKRRSFFAVLCGAVASCFGRQRPVEGMTDDELAAELAYFTQRAQQALRATCLIAHNAREVYTSYSVPRSMTAADLARLSHEWDRRLVAEWRKTFGDTLIPLRHRTFLRDDDQRNLTWVCHSVHPEYRMGYSIEESKIQSVCTNVPPESEELVDYVLHGASSITSQIGVRLERTWSDGPDAAGYRLLLIKCRSCQPWDAGTSQERP